jgi:hypothetical protein
MEKKNLREYSAPFNLLKIKDKSWMCSKKNLWFIEKALDKSPHFPVAGKKQIVNFRLADPIEIKAGKLQTFPRVL